MKLRGINQWAVLDTYSAADVDTSSSPGMIKITGLQWVPTSEKIPYAAATDRVDPVVEVVQIVDIGVTTVPTITAGTKYQIMIGNTGNRREGAQSQPQKFGYTAPAILVSAASDRHNAYIDLAYKVNNASSTLAKAYPIISIATATNACVVGNTVIGATSGAKGIVINNAANLMTIALIGNVLFVTGENITEGAHSDATTAGPTLGLGLRIVDNAGYFPTIKGSGRQGANLVMATAGFLPTMAVQTQAPVYAKGQGTQLLADKPTLNSTDQNLASGSFDYPRNADFTAGAQYRLFIIRSKKSSSNSALDAASGLQSITQGIYVNTASGNLAAFTAAIAAL